MATPTIIRIINQYITENHPHLTTQMATATIWLRRTNIAPVYAEASIHGYPWYTGAIQAPTDRLSLSYPNSTSRTNQITNPNRTHHLLPPLADPNFFPALNKALQKWKTHTQPNNTSKKTTPT